MPDYTASREQTIAGFARPFAWSGAALLVIFVAFVAVDSLPLQLLSPAWQLRFTSRIVNTGVLGLLGFLLLHLALFIEPGNGFLRSRLATARRLALVVVFAFLLLVPLHGFATWRAIAQAQGTEALQRSALNERAATLRQAIEAATSPEDLQARFSRLKGPSPRLPPAAMALPLPELKRALLSELQRTEDRAADRIGGAAPADLWALGQGMARVSIASLGFATAFAAAAQTPGSSQTLLQSLARRVAVLRGQRPRRQRRSP